MTENAKEQRSNLGELLRFLSPELAESEKAPIWPPDAFALVAYVLQRTGGYRTAIHRWPPELLDAEPRPPREWSKKIKSIGREWRRTAVAEKRAPDIVDLWWREVREAEATSISVVAARPRLCESLIQILAAADEACGFLGLSLWRATLKLEEEMLREWREREPYEEPDEMWHSSLRASNLFLVRAAKRIEIASREGAGSTFCSHLVDPWKARVLPKYHTPQTGITLRSFSHNIALGLSDEVALHWYSTELQAREIDQDSGGDSHRMLNILVIPWPDRIERRHIQALEGPGVLRGMPDGYGFFEFRKPELSAEEINERIVGRLDGLYESARHEAGRVDLVVLPEMALDAKEYEAVRKWAREKNVFLISGVGEHGGRGQFGRNLVRFEIPLFDHITIEQPKHHRWQLDRSQIVTYGLVGFLDPDIRWWEGIEVEERSLKLVSISPWLSLCVLVCEDLAQQEPVARLVRSVGPNLLIALLMDGPQLSTRWPARYATVFSSDPGSSVLTVTSLGMCERSVPIGKTPLRTVALWEDARGGRQELSLQPGDEALVINLLMERVEEFTADGRSDGGSAGRPVLVGAYGVRSG